MKYPVIYFKSLKDAIKQLEPVIRNGNAIQTGKPIKQFGNQLPREMLANLLLCLAINSHRDPPDRLTFTSDPKGGDGIILDTVTGETWPTEHVLAPTISGSKAEDVEAVILEKIEFKRQKPGQPYAGKTLVVLLNIEGLKWYPNRVARQLPAPLGFAAVWVVGLQGVEAGEYVYAVTELDVSEGDAPVSLVRIAKNWDAWQVTLLQGEAGA